MRFRYLCIVRQIRLRRGRWLWTCDACETDGRRVKNENKTGRRQRRRRRRRRLIWYYYFVMRWWCEWESLQTAPETCRQRTATDGGGVPRKSTRTTNSPAEWMRFGIPHCSRHPSAPSAPATAVLSHRPPRRYPPPPTAFRRQVCRCVYRYTTTTSTMRWAGAKLATHQTGRGREREREWESEGKTHRKHYCMGS